MSAGTLNLGLEHVDSLVARNPLEDDAEFDITAMIDLVFMMNIYFLVTFLTAAMGEITLPSATHVAPLDPDTAVAVTVLGSLDGESITVYLGENAEGEQISDADMQEERIRKWVEQGVQEGKTAVLIKAEKKVRLKHLFRVSSACAVEGVKLHVSVMEKDASE
jgi:biopolymer transport protein ExbD